MELDQLGDTSLIEELQTAIGEPRFLVWVDNNMVWIGGAVGEDAFADEQSRDAIREADLDCIGRTLTPHPVAQGVPLRTGDRNRKQLVDTAVGMRHRRASCSQ